MIDCGRCPNSTSAPDVSAMEVSEAPVCIARARTQVDRNGKRKRDHLFPLSDLCEDKRAYAERLVKLTGLPAAGVKINLVEL